MRVWTRLAAGSCFLLAGCSLSANPDTDANESASTTWAPHKPADPASCPATAAAGRLTLYLIPPAQKLDWGSPNRLLTTAAQSLLAAAAQKSAGAVGMTHEIGHVNLELDCGADSVALTGQTGGGAEWKSGADGFGVLLRAFDGQMNATPEGGHDAMVDDIKLRQQSGSLTRMTLLVNQATCQRVKAFHDEYVSRGAFKRYGGDFRPRRFEGGGCANWAADVIDVSGMLRRSQFAPLWTQSMLVGNHRFANVGGDGTYPFGSNLVAHAFDGRAVIWPHGKPISASGFPIAPGSGILNTWTGLEDDFQVPFTIFDPMRMAQWAEGVWAQASANGSATALETTWTAGTVEGAHEITTDAHCTDPQAIPFDRDNDDLFKDSDQPN